MTKPEIIELSQEEIDALLERVESDTLQPGDYKVIKGMAETIAYLSHLSEQKGVQVARLLRALFGSKSEKRETILEESEKQETQPKNLDPSSGSEGDNT